MVTPAHSPLRVIIPTYNEARNIRSIVMRVRGAIPNADVLIVDDDSPDGTGRIAQGLADADPHIEVMHRREKNGLGRAYVDAYRETVKLPYRWVAQMDADGSHRAEDLIHLFERAQADDQPDIVIGSRYVPHAAFQGWPLSRQMLSRLGNMYIRAAARTHIHDVTAGFRVYRLEYLASLDFSRIDAQGYYFQTDMTLAGLARHARIVEVPITFVQRQAGESKLSRSIFLESLAKTTRLGVQRWLHPGSRMSS
ncbi:MAG: polyprenol monophosphomannose synthase [Actinomycetaceae bacterium]|nr:polyprenol monophosphomannose synthase [Actinomycetaceae bacterium]MDY6083178.1 polyprenol monophosphomannose synthase [Actinomycetaceae bacterium]